MLAPQPLTVICHLRRTQKRLQVGKIPTEIKQKERKVKHERRFVATTTVVIHIQHETKKGYSQKAYSSPKSSSSHESAIFLVPSIPCWTWSCLLFPLELKPVNSFGDVQMENQFFASKKQLFSIR